MTVKPASFRLRIDWPSKLGHSSKTPEIEGKKFQLYGLETCCASCAQGWEIVPSLFPGAKHL